MIAVAAGTPNKTTICDWILALNVYDLQLQLPVTTMATLVIDQSCFRATRIVKFIYAQNRLLKSFLAGTIS